MFWLKPLLPVMAQRYMVNKVKPTGGQYPLHNGQF
jgi:hypothetical protein